MAQKTLVLMGTRGHAVGEVFMLFPGKTYVVGRSRSCDISFRNLPSWRERSQEERDTDLGFKTISGKHFCLAVTGEGEVTVEDLSSNGTFLDSRRMTAPVMVTDLDEREHFIRFGTHEEMVLTMQTAET